MSDVNRLLAEIPNSVRAITGVDLTKVSLALAAGNASCSKGTEICLEAFSLPGSLSFPSPDHHREQAVPCLPLLQP